MGLLNCIFYLHVSLEVKIAPARHPSDLLFSGPVLSVLSLEGALDLFVFSLPQKTELVSWWGNKIVKVITEFFSELKPTSLDCLRYYNILSSKCVFEISFP